MNPYNLTASNYVNHLSDATSNGYATFTVLKNGNPTMLAASSSPGQTGYFMDSTHSVSFSTATHDAIANQITGHANDENNAEVTWYNAGLLLTASA